ncbi:MAG: L-aspartate oxidase [Chitinophagales bacterium]|nr:L-aspartate oxidase [Chitinophagales bacterium]
MNLSSDILVIGSGIAGLSFAYKCAEKFPDKKIILITKSDEEESNTKYAQGGIAGVINFDNDSYEKHIQDTLIAGDGLCRKETVELVVRESTARIKELIELGTNFDKNADGDFDLGKEGGHSSNRILHYKDATGKEMERALLEKVHSLKNIEILNHCFVVDLITQHHLGYMVTKATPDITCYGAYVLDTRTNQIKKVEAKVIMLATGGVGQAYRTTTNPSIATGDGIAMFYRAKGRVENMEFIQFHPTALFQQGTTPSFLITEAIRGKGAILRNRKGEAFMDKYDERRELAPRDIVARAIDSEMKLGGNEHVWLDCTNIDAKVLQEHFPTIFEKCLSIGIDMRIDFIPVAPAAHYSCGGIKVDEKARTSIQRVYAVGECSSTGLHGANRLASNSLLEALVYAQRAFNDVAEIIDKTPAIPNIPDWNASGTSTPKELILLTQSLKEVKSTMSDYVGIVRSNERLARANRRIDLLWEETEDLYNNTTLSPQLCELRNLITVAYLIIKGASFRKESRGLHYTTDYPEKSLVCQDLVW